MTLNPHKLEIRQTVYSSRYRRDIRVAEWTPEAVEKLREWYPHNSAAWIGLQFGVTKDAVISKAHSIGLTKPSPLHPPGADENRQARKKQHMVVDGDTAASKPPRNETGLHVVHQPAPAPGVYPPDHPKMAIGQPRQQIAPSPLPIAPPKACQWVVESGRARMPIFCDQPVTEPRSAWCPQHQAVCYQRSSRQVSRESYEQQTRQYG